LFLYKEPSKEWISRFLDAQRDAPFSYDEVGASREAAKELAGYAVDHNRARLGEGRGTLGRAVAVLYVRPFCHNPTLQQYHLLSVTTAVTGQAPRKT
jgi:hypothetical protein